MTSSTQNTKKWRALSESYFDSFWPWNVLQVLLKKPNLQHWTAPNKKHGSAANSKYKFYDDPYKLTTLSVAGDGDVVLFGVTLSLSFSWTIMFRVLGGKTNPPTICSMINWYWYVRKSNRHQFNSQATLGWKELLTAFPAGGFSR